MNAKVTSTTTPTACDGTQFLVQIMGENHPEGQRIYLADKNGENIIEPDKVDKIKETSANENEPGTFLSTLHIWDWCKVEGKNLQLWLEIATTEGEPIKLLLLTDVRKTQKLYDKQINQITPIVPCTMLGKALKINVNKTEATSGGVKAHDFGVPVLARQGYFYIFKSGVIWRELRIEQDTSGNTTYHDVDIASYLLDTKEGLLASIDREVIGKPLKEIWLPTNMNDAGEEFTFLYSEVQLSGARLNHLSVNGQSFKQHPKTTLKNTVVAKSNQGKLAETLLTGNQLIQILDASALSTSTPKSGYSKLVATIDTIKANLMPATAFEPHQPRDAGIELSLDQPQKYLYDKTGNYCNEALAFAQTFMDNCEKGQPTNDLNKLEIGAWTHLLNQKIKADQEYKAKVASYTKKIISQLPTMSNLSNWARSGVATAINVQSTSTATVANMATVGTTDQAKAAGAANVTQALPIASVVTKLRDSFEQTIAETSNNKSQQQEVLTLWDSPPTTKVDDTNNALKDAQQRKIFCVCVEDSHFRTRQYAASMLACQQQMRLVTQQATTRPYFDSALLVQQLLVPERIGPKNKYNKLRDNLKYLSPEGFKKIAYNSCVLERSEVVKRHQFIQRKLIENLNNQQGLQIWADHLSQEDEISYASAYGYLVTNLMLLEAGTNTLDPYLGQDNSIYYGKVPRVTAYFIEQGYNFIVNMMQQPESTLHKMLFEPVSLEQIMKPKELADTVRFNCGDGVARLDLLRKAMAKNEITPDLIKSYDAVSLNLQVEIAKANNEIAKDLTKAMFTVIGNIRSTLANIVSDAYQKLSSRKLELQDVRAKFNNIKVAYDQARIKEADLQNQLNDINKQIADINTQQADVKAQQDANHQRTMEMNTEVNTAGGKVYGRQLRLDSYRNSNEVLAIKARYVEALMANQMIEMIANKTPTSISVFNSNGNTVHVFRAIDLDLTRELFNQQFSKVRLAVSNNIPPGTRVIAFPTNIGKNAEILAAIQAKLGTNADVTNLVLVAEEGSIPDDYFFQDPAATATPTIAEEIEQAKARLAEAEQDKQAADLKREQELQRALKERETHVKASTAGVEEAERKLARALGTPNEAQAKVELAEARRTHNKAQSLLNNAESDIKIMEAHSRALTAEVRAAKIELDILLYQQQIERGEITADNQRLQQQQIDLGVANRQLAQAKQNLELAIAEHQAACAKNGVPSTIDYNKLRQQLKDAQQRYAEARAAHTAAKNGQLYRVVNSPVIKTALVGFQLYNFHVALTSAQQDIRTKGWLRTASGVLVSTGDVMLAVEDVVAHLKKQHISKIGWQRIVAKPAASKVGLWVTSRLPVTLATEVAFVGVLQTFFGAVAFGNSLYELFYSLSWGDSGWVVTAHVMGMLGAVMAMAAPWVASGAPILMMSPLGLAALVVLAIAFIILIICSASELERWLKRGPFGDEVKPHLQDPTEAFYRLLGIFANIQITIDKNPDYNHREANQILRQEYADKGFTLGKFVGRQRIRITSGIQGLIGDNKLENNFHLGVISTQLFGGLMSEEIRAKHFKIRSTEDIDGGKQYIVDQPVADYRWVVCAQFKTNYNGHPFCFPTPDITDPTPYLDAVLREEHSKPNLDRVFYRSTKPLFWATEESHD